VTSLAPVTTYVQRPVVLRIQTYRPVVTTVCSYRPACPCSPCANGPLAESPRHELLCAGGDRGPRAELRLRRSTALRWARPRRLLCSFDGELLGAATTSYYAPPTTSYSGAADNELLCSGRFERGCRDHLLPAELHDHVSFVGDERHDHDRSDFEWLDNDWLSLDDLLQRVPANVAPGSRVFQFINEWRRWGKHRRAVAAEQSYQRQLNSSAEAGRRRPAAGSSEATAADFRTTRNRPREARPGS